MTEEIINRVNGSSNASEEVRSTEEVIDGSNAAKVIVDRCDGSRRARRDDEGGAARTSIRTRSYPYAKECYKITQFLHSTFNKTFSATKRRVVSAASNGRLF